MKKLVNNFFLALLLIGFCGSSYFAQTTATNFTANDCDGDSYDLFTELNSGKIIVIVWVMPCAGCISGALAAYSTVQTYQSSNPGKVFYYLADDYANSTCSTLRGWANTNGITDATFFSNAAVDMADYGVAGMPKVIVLAGNTHTVFYNENNLDINENDIADAIDQALLVVSVPENESDKKELNIYPNPSDEFMTIDLEKSIDQNSSIFLYDLSGNKISVSTNEKADFDPNTIQINTKDLKSGTYILHYQSGGKTSYSKISIVH